MRDVPRRAVQAVTPVPAHATSTYGEVTAEAAGLYARGMAATAHLLVLLSLPGLALVGLIWLLHRHRLPYVEHHARQAMRWQVRINAGALLTGVVLLVALFAGFGAGVGKPSTGDSIAGSLAILALLGLLLLFTAWIVLALVSAAVGATTALLGREPRPLRKAR